MSETPKEIQCTATIRPGFSLTIRRGSLCGWVAETEFREELGRKGDTAAFSNYEDLLSWLKESLERSAHLIGSGAQQ